MQHRLAAEARQRLSDRLFGEFVEFAISVNNIDELLEAALKLGQLDDAARLAAQLGKGRQGG